MQRVELASIRSSGARNEGASVVVTAGAGVGLLSLASARRRDVPCRPGSTVLAYG